MFESLSDKLQKAFTGFKSKGHLTEDDINDGIREIRMALLEADVNYKVVKNFTRRVKERCLTAEVMDSLTPGQNVIKIVLDELTELLGGSVRFHGDYPAWTYARESALRDRCVAVYEAQYGAKPQIVAIHAGLECGILSGKIDGLDCISFGPNLLHVHTPNERADIASVARVWEYLKAILAYKA